MIVTLELNEEDEHLIRDFARLQGITVNEFLCRAALEKIEDEQGTGAKSTADSQRSLLRR